MSNYGRPIRPVDRKYPISLVFGALRPGLWRTHDDHWGTDFACPVGTPVYAVEDGFILFAQEDPGGWGHFLELKAGNDYYIYGHLSEWKVKEGDKVTKGQVIGLTGNTGNSTGPHLHFEHRYMGNTSAYVKPVVFFDDFNGAYYG